MRNKFLLAATVATGLALFVWQSISHVVLPWHNMTMSELADTAAVAQAVRASAPENGVYFAKSGVFAIVRVEPGVSDTTTLVPRFLARQMVLNLLAAAVLAFGVLMGGPVAPRQLAGRLALVAVPAAIIIHASNWNWYGFSPAFTLVVMTDFVIQWAVAGLVIGALSQRMLGGAAAGAAGVSLPAGAGLPTGGARQPTAGERK